MNCPCFDMLPPARLYALRLIQERGSLWKRDAAAYSAPDGHPNALVSTRSVRTLDTLGLVELFGLRLWLTSTASTPGDLVVTQTFAGDQLLRWWR